MSARRSGVRAVWSAAAAKNWLLGRHVVGQDGVATYYVHTQQTRDGPLQRRTFELQAGLDIDDVELPTASLAWLRGTRQVFPSAEEQESAASERKQRSLNAAKVTAEEELRRARKRAMSGDESTPPDSLSGGAYTPEAWTPGR